MSSETPFKITVPQEKLDLLKRKLELATLPDELDDAGWDYGAPLADIRRLVARWKDGYDWRKEEAKLNEELPQFTKDIEVDGFGSLNVHYVHQKSSVVDAIPLLFVHGWPGIFIEVRKVLPLLTTNTVDGPSFHVVALSLPGYGFSEGVKKKGFSIPQYAELGHKLMLALGYDEYVTQGGDWGHIITRAIATIYGGKHSKAWHTNFPLTAPPTLLSNPIVYIKHLFTPYTAQEKIGFAQYQYFEQRLMGYFREQSTQPQTLGYSLSDSPVGLLAWIYEKLALTRDYKWNDDEILTWISIYWFSRAGPASSLRIYYEATEGGTKDIFTPAPGTSPKIPTGVSIFPGELTIPPKRWLEATFGNLVFVGRHEKGGHFAAHENPEGLVSDVRKMFGRGGPAFGVVPGKTGYA